MESEDGECNPNAVFYIHTKFEAYLREVFRLAGVPFCVSFLC